MPVVHDNEVTILFDEAHGLPKDLTMAFLTIFNTEKNHKKIFEWDGMNFEFDFKRHCTRQCLDCVLSRTVRDIIWDASI